MGAINPMQRKARNSFLLGMLIMLIISAIIIGFLFMMLVKEKKQQKQEVRQSAYVLTQDVSSGETIDISMMKSVQVPQAAVSSTAFKEFPISEKTGEEMEIKAKIDLSVGTILTDEMFYANDIEMRSDLRRQEYNMIALPVQMEVGDYIDIRLTIPTGENFVVVAKKEVLDANATTVWVELTEDEILLMSSAIVEAYKMGGSKLDAAVYTEPGLQEAATITYQPTQNIEYLIKNNPSIVPEAKTYLSSIKNQDFRTLIQMSVDQGRPENVETKVQEEITKQKEERANYLSGL